MISTALAFSGTRPSRKSWSASIRLLFGHPGEPAGLRFVAGDDAEVLQDPLQQVFLGQKRVQNQRRERLPIDLLEQRPAERRLSGPDVAGDDDESFAAADGVLQQLERVGVRLAAVQVLRIGRQAERLLGEPVIVFVHQCAPAGATIVGVSRITSSNRFRVTTVERPNHPPATPVLLALANFLLARQPRHHDGLAVVDAREHVGFANRSGCPGRLRRLPRLGSLTMGLRLSMTTRSEQIRGVTPRVKAYSWCSCPPAGTRDTARTTAGSLFSASTRGVASVVTVPCAASAVRKRATSVTRSALTRRLPAACAGRGARLLRQRLPVE